MENLEVPPIIPRKKTDVYGRRRPENQLGKLDRGVMSRAGTSRCSDPQLERRPLKPEGSTSFGF